MLKTETNQFDGLASFLIKSIRSYIRVENIFRSNQPNLLPQIQSETLNSIERVLDELEKTEILDEVLPMLNKAKLTEPIVLIPAVSKYLLSVFSVILFAQEAAPRQNNFRSD